MATQERDTMRQIGLGMMVGALFVASAAWFWSNLPNGDFWLLVRAGFEEPLHAQVIPPIEANLLGLIVSALAFTFMASIMADVVNIVGSEAAFSKAAFLVVFLCFAFGVIFGINGVIGVFNVSGRGVLAIITSNLGLAYFAGVVFVVVAYCVGIGGIVISSGADEHRGYGYKWIVGVSALITALLFGAIWIGVKHRMAVLEPFPVSTNPLVTVVQSHHILFTNLHLPM